ncbi:MAG: hypothetical protein L7F77_10380 [Candidatus Magnetominusculus sp. LBB02]|nr:hypothetical protein [Candidatus Magnetominusculus sp. LBB02]
MYGQKKGTDFIILKGEKVREIAGYKSHSRHKACDCLIIRTKKNKIVQLLLVEIEEGKNKKASEVRDQLRAGVELLKSILQDKDNPIDGNYVKKCIFLCEKNRGTRLKKFRECSNYIDGKPIQVEECGYTYDCTMH